MKNLNSQEKKSLFRLGLVFAGIVLLGLLYWGINGIYNYQANKFINEKKALIETYQLKIDSINLVNTKLVETIQVLDREVDSLKDSKIIIYKEYDKKVDVINDASAADHAKWMESVLIELKNNKQFNY